MKTKRLILGLLLILFSMHLSAQELPPVVKNLESMGFKVFYIGEGYYKYQNLTSRGMEPLLESLRPWEHFETGDYLSRGVPK